MSPTRSFRPRALIVTGGLLLSLLAGTAKAQVTTDGSVGAVVTQNGATITIPQNLGLTNASGTTVLHSFSQFDITSSQTVTFQGSSSLTAIIARITGGTASSIDGTITSTAPNAALFLINPNGFVFGPNSVINVPGSLYISTADKLNFADGTAIAMTSTPIGTLSTASIASFGFLGAGTGNITLNGAAGGTSPYWLVLGDLDIIGSNLSFSETNMYVGDPDPAVRSQVRIGSVGAATGTVGLDGAIGLSGGTLTADDLNMLHTANGPNESVNDEYFSGSALTFTGDSLRFYTDEAHGRTDTISLQADSIDMVNGIVDNFVQTTPSATAQRPVFNVSVTGPLTLNNFNVYLASWAAPGAIMTVNAGSMSMVDSTIILSGSAYDGGQLRLTTSGNFSMDNSEINANVVGNLNGYAFGSSYNPADPGNAGTLNLTIGGQMAMTNGSEITVGSDTPDGTAGGAAGTLTVHAGSLVVSESDMTADAVAGNRAAGTLTITTTGDASFTNDNAVDGNPALDALSANGSGGTVVLDVGGALTTNNATFSVVGDQSGATAGAAGVATPATSAGQITVTAASLNSTGSTYTFSGSGAASGGTLAITTTGDADFASPDIDGRSDTAAGGTFLVSTGGDLAFSGTAPGTPGYVIVDGNGAGAAGNITLKSTGNFTSTNMYVSETGFGTSNAGGNFTVNGGGDIDMTDTEIDTNALGGVGGNIVVAGRDINLTGSYLFVAGPLDQSGNIAVSGNTVLLDSTWLYGESNAGIGGNIVVKANALTMVGNSLSDFQASQGSAFDPNNGILFNGLAYDTGAYIETAGINDSGSILVEARTLTIGNNAIIMGAQPDFTVNAATNENVFSGWGPASANVTVHANTLVINPGTTIITAAGPTSQAGTLTLGATDLTMKGGVVETIGGTGGSIRIGADNSLTLNGGEVKTDISGTSAGGQDGDIDLGVTLSNPILTNAACDTACAGLFPFSTAWVPGTHFGFPATYRNPGATVEALARGVVGRDVGQDMGFEPDDAVLPGRETAQVDTTTVTGGQALVVGPYFYPANSRAPASLCAAADALQQGKSTMANLLMRIPDQASGGLGPETYDLSDAADGTQLSLNTGCLDVLDPRHDRLSPVGVSLRRPARLVFDPARPAS